MKYPIVHTNFLENLVNDFNEIVWCIGINYTYTVEKLYNDDCNHRFDIVDIMRERLLKELALVEKHYEIYDPSDHEEIKQGIIQTDRLFQELCLLDDLTGPRYAHPDYIAGSIKTLSDLLESQLVAKSQEDPYYDSYYCKVIAEVLSELCQLIKEV